MERNENNKYLGRWRIIEMELWDKDFIDLVGQGHITFKPKNQGSLQFGAVDCDLDCRLEKFGDVEVMNFSFVGEDEGDTIWGRGWAVIGRGNRLMGRIYFYQGDDSGFVASKTP